MGTDLLEKPDSEQDDDNQSLFNKDTSQGVYDDKFEKIISGLNDDNKSSKGKKLSTSAIKEAEGGAGGISADSGSNKELSSLGSNSGDDSGGWATNIGKKKSSKVSINRRLAAGGAAAGFGIGGIFGLSVMFSGPMQFIHMAQMMQNFHFFGNEESSDDRVSKIHKYLKNRKTKENLRLNKVEGKIAKRVDERLKKQGISSNFENGYLKSYDIDSEEFAKSKGIKNTEASLKEHIKTTYGVDASCSGGKCKINTDELGYFKNRKLSKTMMSDMGHSRIGGAMKARIMTKRSGATLHPLKLLDKKLKESADARYKDWKKNRAERNNKGVKQEVKVTNPGETDADGKPKPDPGGDANKAAVEAAGAEAGEVGAEIRSGDIKPEGPKAKLKGKFKTAGKVAGGVTAAVGFVCMLDSMSKSLDLIKHTNVVLPLMRLGMEGIAVGNQVMSGEGVDMEALGNFNRMLNDPETKSSWAEAMSIQAELGKEPTGKNILPEAAIQNEGNPVTQALSAVKSAGVPIEEVCGAVSSTVGQVVSLAIDVASGPFSAAGGLAFSTFVAGPLGEALIGWLAGNPIDVNVAGADLGNYINYGARLSAGSTAMLSGGKNLGKKSAMEWKEYRIAVEKEDMQSMSIASRIFNPYDYRTLAGRTLDSTNTDATGNIASIFTGSTRLIPNLTKTFSNIIIPKASAAAANSYDYGFDTYGFDIGELKNEKIENPYDNGEKADTLLSGPKGEELKKRAKVCFGTTFDDSNNPNSSEEKDVPQMAEVNKPEFNCADRSEDWLRIRTYIFDTQLGDSLACYEDDESSCALIGAGSTGSTQTTTTGDNVTVGGDSSSAQCGAGTDKGAADGYAGGKMTKIKICEVQGITVNAQVSKKLDEMITAAKSEGVTLTGSGFRSNEEQISLRQAHGCPDPSTPSSGCTPQTAIPGFSNHQMGVAIDFKNCSAGSPSFNWLKGNAEKFGFKNLPAESWHWSIDGH